MGNTNKGEKMEITNINDLPGEVAQQKGIVKEGLNSWEEAENKRISAITKKRPEDYKNVWKCCFCGKQYWVTPKSGKCGCGWEKQNKTMKGI